MTLAIKDPGEITVRFRTPHSALRTPHSARSNPVSLVGTRCCTSVGSVRPLSLRRIVLDHPAAPVSVCRNNPFRPDAAVSARWTGAVRTETGFPARPQATFRPKMPPQHAGTPLSDLPAPIRQGQTHLSGPQTPILPAQTHPSDPKPRLSPPQPPETKPFSRKRAQRTQKGTQPTTPLKETLTNDAPQRRDGRRARRINVFLCGCPASAV
jgi:hypothetical protein